MTHEYLTRTGSLAVTEALISNSDVSDASGYGLGEVLQQMHA